MNIKSSFRYTKCELINIRMLESFKKSLCKTKQEMENDLSHPQGCSGDSVALVYFERGKEQGKFLWLGLQKL